MYGLTSWVLYLTLCQFRLVFPVLSSLATCHKQPILLDSAHGYNYKLFCTSSALLDLLTRQQQLALTSRTFLKMFSDCHNRNCKIKCPLPVLFVEPVGALALFGGTHCMQFKVILLFLSC